MPRIYQILFKGSFLGPYSLSRRSLFTVTDVIRAGDRVLLQSQGRDSFLSKVLRPNGSTSTQYGEVMHANIIGRKSRDTIISSKGSELRVFLPSLADYVTMTPRNVTPVYPADANLIVSLLDLHIQPSDTIKNGPPSLEILEAGTGHGALTLYLARAVHGANTLPVRGRSTTDTGDAIPNETNDSSDQEKLQAIEEDSGLHLPTSYDHQSDQRQAVIHTVDVSTKHRKDARAIVKGFRQGMYYNDVEFHLGDISEWIHQQTSKRDPDAKDAAFLSHILLDLPSADQHIEKAASALHVNGTLLVFNPSITQIIAIVKIIKRRYLPLQLDRVVELGANMTGGREWDVRAVKPRAVGRAAAEKGRAGIGGKVEVQREGYKPERDDEIHNTCSETTNEENFRAKEQESGWEMVCRPKVGDRVAGGGFLGVWKKMKW